MNLGAECNLYNVTQPDMSVHLRAGSFLAITYGGNLRLGVSGEDPFVELRALPDKVLVRPEYSGHKIWLNLWHGRKDPKEQMDEMGFCGNDVEGHVPPTGDVILFVKEGARVITYDQKAEQGWTEVLVPYVEDMLFYEGNYYGDWSADNDGKV